MIIVKYITINIKEFDMDNYALTSTPTPVSAMHTAIRAREVI
jgi:hypothetical protein